jgi:threonyl-tRNA synthetase
MKEANQKPKDNLEIRRHSCSHLMAAAILEIWPETKLAIGPAIEGGFYYDFEFAKPFSDNDLPKIEAKMSQIQKLNDSFVKKNLSVRQAIKLFANQSYKIELIKDLVKNEGVKQVSTYTIGKFTDLCAGPHVESTQKIGSFKLLSTAGAYWHGDEKNKMLTRIYGTCFPTQEELDHYLWQIEEVKKRDHRVLNDVLKLYTISEELGQGLVTLLPNGAIIADELEKWAKETERKWGYVRVLTPHIASEKLFRKTGHVPYYVDHMYPPMRMEEKGRDEKDIYWLKPMNCAGHHLVFKAQPRSYRDLPLRIAEYGTVYRYEYSGDLHGMMRVRGPIHQNDAHIFCTPEQAEEEFQKVMELHRYYYDTLGLTADDYYLSFAIRDKKNKSKYLGSTKMWEKAEKITLRYIKKTGIPYVIEEGGAAFYGPKIDFNIRTVTGKAFSASTNQLDFFIPKAFDLKYVDKDGKGKTPVCIHRAPLGAHVRFIAFLTEYYAGAFPVWLAPVQVKIILVTQKSEAYAKKVYQKLFDLGIRVEINDRNETIPAKIRNAEIEKIPYMAVIGPKEEEKGSVNVRIRGEKVLGLMSVEKFIELLKEDIDKKRQV